MSDLRRRYGLDGRNAASGPAIKHPQLALPF
jgi:hypothetical protein